LSAQVGNGVKQLTAVADKTNAKILQVLGRQVEQNRIVDCVLAECCLVVFEAEAS